MKRLAPAERISHSVYPSARMPVYTLEDWRQIIHVELHRISKDVRLAEKGMCECWQCGRAFRESFVRLSCDLVYSDTSRLCGYCSGEVEEREEHESPGIGEWADFLYEQKFDK